jgi:hypothetical protein
MEDIQRLLVLAHLDLEARAGAPVRHRHEYALVALVPEEPLMLGFASVCVAALLTPAPLRVAPAAV